MKFFSSLKNRLQVMVVAMLLPLVLLVIYADLRHRGSVEADIRKDVRSLGALVTDDLNRHIDDTRELLLVLSQSSEMRRGECGAGTDFPGKIQSKFPEYANVGVVDPQGNIVCSSVPLKRPTNVSDLHWFREAVRTRDFSIGEYQIDRITGTPVLALGQPVFGEDGGIRSILFASLSLGWMQRIATSAKLYSDSAIIISDRNGIIITRHPDTERWEGKPAPELFRRELLRREPVLAEIPGVDGGARIYFFSPAGYKGGDLHLAIGVSKRVAFAQINKDLANDFVLLLLVSGGCLLGARYFLDAGILRAVAALKDAAERMAGGDLGARAGLVSGTDEILLLAGTFDRMAEVLQDNSDANKEIEKKLGRTARTLSAVNKCNELIAHAWEEQALLDNVCKSIVSEEGYRFAWVGFAERDERKSIRPVAQAGFEEGYLETANITWEDTERGKGPTGTAIRTSAPSVCRYISTDPEFESWRAEAIKRGYAASVALPLRFDEHSFGAINVYAEEPDAFDEEEIRMLGGMAETLAYGIRSLRMAAERDKALGELARHRERLEELVSERTADLAQANLRLREADKLKSVFLATMSHELRTPLNSIIGFTGILLQGLAGPINEEQVKQLGMVRKSAHHLLALINDVLDISKIEAGQLEIAREPFDVPETIESVRKTMEPLAVKKGLALSTEIGSGVGSAVSDRRRVEQVLINLVGNAIKFTESGEVRVECRSVDGRLEIRVVDTGIGIRPEEMGRLFVPFHQVDTGLARKHEGTGLGLSISGKLAEMLGGEIRAESEWGTGSTFTFTLPMEGGSGEKDPGHRG